MENDTTVTDEVETLDNNEYGKFKSADELLKAYIELEKEFTKKSQKLKEMERVETPKEEEVPFNEVVEKFFSENEKAKPFSKEMALFLEGNPELVKDKNCLSVALSKVLLNNWVGKENLAKDEKFLNEYIFSNKAVKEKIIDEFLNSLPSAPQVIKSGQAFMSPPSKPKTIEEAGWMLKQLNK